MIEGKKRLLSYTFILASSWAVPVTLLRYPPAGHGESFGIGQRRRTRRIKGPYHPWRLSSMLDGRDDDGRRPSGAHRHGARRGSVLARRLHGHLSRPFGRLHLEPRIDGIRYQISLTQNRK